MGVIYRIDDGPVEKQSLGDIYRGQSLSPQAQAIGLHKTLCPKDGKQFTQQDPGKIFLVPTQPSVIPNYP